MTRLVLAAPIAGAILAAAVVMVRAVLALSAGGDVNLVSGVWLALARDVEDGVFYRALSDGGKYGGTRYFPLLFVLIAGWMRAGLPAIAAGQVAGLLGGAVLVTGAFAFLTRLSVARPLAVSGAMLAVAPYFVLQSIFAIRAEPLAAGLALWGASFVAGGIGGRGARHWVAAAAWCFVLAAAAKPTSVYAGAAAVLALIGAGRQRDALRLAILCTGGWLLLLAAVWLASDGRAIESFRTTALAGESPAAFFRPALLLHPIGLIVTSRYLTVVLVVVLAALVSSPRDVCRLPALLVILGSAASAAALATPGTILTNQIVEPYVAGALYLAWAADGRAALRRAGHAVLAALLVWASAQNARAIGVLIQGDVLNTAPAGRAALLAAAKRCPHPLLAESPLVPVLAGQRPVLLDPFAFRVAAMSRPDLAGDLVRRLREREFGCVLLEMDPQSDRGRGWYANVHLGTAVVGAVLEHYTYRESIAGRRLYVPND